MNEILVEVSDVTLEQIKLAADRRGIEPEKMIQAIILDWALHDLVTRTQK